MATKMYDPAVDNVMPAGLPYWIPAYYVGGSLSQYNAAMNPAFKDIGVFFPQDTSQLPNVLAGYALVPFDAQAQAAVWVGLKTYERIIDVKFNPVSFGDAPGVINLIKANTPAGIGGYGLKIKTFAPGSVIISSDALRFGPGGDASTISHELMHALGLNHPHEGMYKVNYQDNGPLWTNVIGTTTDPEPIPADVRASLEGFEPRPLDIAALQYLYGPSKTVRTGNDTYTLVENNPNFIWDGVGNDTIDGSALSAALTLDLNPGTWGFIGAKSDHITAPGQVTVNYGSVIENILGSRFDDSLTGNSADNRLEGNAGNDSFWPGAGNDVVVGGSGIDAMVLNGPRSSYTVNAFDPATGSVTLTSATDGRKDISSVERVLFNNGTEGVALDLHNGGTAGEVAKIIGAVLPHYANTKALAGEGLRLLDSGMPREKVSELALNIALGANSTNTDVVNLLWTNLFGKAPTSAEATPFVQALDAGYFTRGSLTGFAADLLDQKVGLTGVGYLEYTPFVG